MGKKDDPVDGAAAGGALAALDMGLRVKRRAYEERLAALQTELRRVQQAYRGSSSSAVVVFEGWDAAGKGGAIRRISSALDPRSLKVWPISAPREYFRERHYLQRFWEKLPPDGGLAIFDRSWYGRVLVERVEGFAEPAAWERAYAEINGFEQLLMDEGARVIKFFLHITPEEQLSRFERRLLDPLKRWKLSAEDFRNRARWADYEAAIEEMLARTSTQAAPWALIPANNKKYARLAVMETLIERLSDGIDLSPTPLNPDVLAAAKRAFDLDKKTWDEVLDT